MGLGELGGMEWWFLGIGLRVGMLTVYLYHKCSTCRKAVGWLRARGIAFEERAIREVPPSVEELRLAMRAKGGEIRRLFNTSGVDYRSMGMKDRLVGMSEEETLRLLAGHGNLVKRPFVVDAESGVVVVGFDEAEWGRELASVG